MSDTDMCWLPAIEMAAAIRTRQLSPVELVDALLSRIHQLNPAINAYCIPTAVGTDGAGSIVRCSMHAQLRPGWCQVA
jgi:hypothetical protein